MRIKTFQPDMALDGDLLDDWVLEHMRDLSIAAPFGNGRVQLGLAFDGFMLPKEQVVSLYDQARSVGVQIITSHFVPGYFGEYTRPQQLGHC